MVIFTCLKTLPTLSTLEKTLLQLFSHFLNFVQIRRSKFRSNLLRYFLRFILCLGLHWFRWNRIVRIPKMRTTILGRRIRISACIWLRVYLRLVLFIWINVTHIRWSIWSVSSFVIWPYNSGIGLCRKRLRLVSRWIRHISRIKSTVLRISRNLVVWLSVTVILCFYLFLTILIFIVRLLRWWIGTSVRMFLWSCLI